MWENLSSDTSHIKDSEESCIMQGVCFFELFRERKLTLTGMGNSVVIVGMGGGGQMEVEEDRGGINGDENNKVKYIFIEFNGVTFE